MVKKSPEIMQAICQNIADGFPISAACGRNGVSVSSWYSWQSQSRQGNEEFSLEFAGNRMMLHEAIEVAFNMLVYEGASRFMKRATYGHDEEIFFQGRACYEERPDCVGKTDDEVKELGFDHRYVINDDGSVRRLVRHHEPPVAAVIRMLETFIPTWQQTSNLNVNQSVNGVVEVKSRYAAKKVQAPVQVEVIEGPKAISEADLAELLDGPAKADVLHEKQAAPEPVMVSAPEPAAPQDRFGNLTPEQQAVLSRLRARVPANATTQPTGLVARFDTPTPDDTKGSPAPGGMKVI